MPGINIGSSRDEFWQKPKRKMKFDLQKCQMIAEWVKITEFYH